MKKSSILDYFKSQSNIKVNCPACNLLVLKIKLNEHLDSTCSSEVTDLQLQSSRSNAKSNSERNKKPATSSKLNLKNQRKKLSKPATGKKLSNQILNIDLDDDVVFLDEVPASESASKKIGNDLRSFDSSLSERNYLKLSIAKQNGKVEIDERVLIKENNFNVASLDEACHQASPLRRNPKRPGKLSKSSRPSKIVKSETSKPETHVKDDNNVVPTSRQTVNNELSNNVLKRSVKANSSLLRENNIEESNSIKISKSTNEEFINDKNYNEQESLKSVELGTIDKDAIVETFKLSSQRSNDILHLSSNMSSCQTSTLIKKVIGNLKEKSDDFCDKLNSNSKNRIESFGVGKELADVKQCLDNMSAFSELSDGNEKEENEVAKKVHTPYYIANFRHILNCVLNEEDNKILFNEEDMRFVDGFNSLSGKI